MNRGVGGWDGHQAPEFGVWGRSTKTDSGSDRTKPVCNPRNDRKGVGPRLGPATRRKGSTTGPRGSRAKLRRSS